MKLDLLCSVHGHYCIRQNAGSSYLMMLVLGLSIYKVVELLAMFEVLAGLITKPQAALSI